jgi:hypothetical protein
MSDPAVAAMTGFFGTFIAYFIGWLVFRLIAKQNNPMKKPTDIQIRPRWFLALWTGLMVGVVLSMPIIGLGGDLFGEVVVRLVFFIMFLIPGLIGYWVYKRKVK